MLTWIGFVASFGGISFWPFGKMIGSSNRRDQLIAAASALLREIRSAEPDPCTEAVPGLSELLPCGRFLFGLASDEIGDALGL